MSDKPAGTADVLVAGGGFAGLAAATALAAEGVRVLLVEARPQLGGRARSWIDPITGAVIDNGQHLFMGCYDETLKLLDRLGTRDQLGLQKSLAVTLLQRDGRERVFRLPQAPTRFAALIGLLRSPALGWGDRVRLLRVVRAARRAPAAQPAAQRVTAHRAPAAGAAAHDLHDAAADDPLDRATVAEWLEVLGQSAEARRRLWDPLAIAVLNELPERAAAGGLAAVLRLAFDGGPQRSALGVSKVGLSDLYAEPAARFLRSRGCEVRTRAPVHRLLIEGERCTGALLSGGERLTARTVISALPPRELAEILPPGLAESPPFSDAARLGDQSIVSLYLWFGSAVTDLPFAGLLDSTWQWVFNRCALMQEPRAGTHHVTLVRSAAGEFAESSKEHLVKTALDDLRACFPRASLPAPRHALVIKERHATVSLGPGSARLRPSYTTPLPGLLLAGDWTATGLPATIESAVLSGHACARLAMSP